MGMFSLLGKPSDFYMPCKCQGCSDPTLKGITCICTYASVGHTPLRKKPGYLLTRTLPTSCNGHPKIPHPIYQWNNAYTDSGPVHHQPRLGGHLQLAMLCELCVRFRGKLSWQNLKNILGLKSLHRKNTIKVLPIKFVLFLQNFDDYCKDLPVRTGTDVTPQGKHLLDWPLATRVKDRCVTRAQEP